MIDVLKLLQMKILVSTILHVVPTSFSIKAILPLLIRKDIVQSYRTTCNIPKVIIADELSDRTTQHQATKTAFSEGESSNPPFLGVVTHSDIQAYAIELILYICAETTLTKLTQTQK